MKLLLDEMFTGLKGAGDMEVARYAKENGLILATEDKRKPVDFMKLLGDPDVVHDEQTRYRTRVNCANEGIPDGATAKPSHSTDGYSHEARMAVITQLRQTLLMSVKEIGRESR